MASTATGTSPVSVAATSQTSAASTLAPGLARKVKKILEIKTEAPELIGSLQTLSTFYTDNTAASRRALRSTVEKRSLLICDKFITAAEDVIRSLDDVQRSLDMLSTSCGNITSALSATKSSSSALLGETERLQRELEGVERRQELVNQFLEQYQLKPEEVAALQSEEVNAAFFSALSCVRTIHDNCRSLLRTHHQRAGLELMDMMAQHQETAYERLCRWVQGQCRNIGEFDAPEVDPLLQAAVQALRERPVLFKYCAEEVATARHNALFGRFITALTRGGPGGVPRPIEIHAHDPQRYCNDMLAWVHQALASEREFVVALFGDEPGRSSEDGGDNILHKGSLLGDGLNTSALLDRIFESICRPLRVRVEQMLMTSPPLLLCFTLSQLLGFYHSLTIGILGASGQLSQALASCKAMAHRVFFEQLRSRADKLRRNPPAPPKDLSAPPQFAEAAHQMLEIIHAHDSALATSAMTAAGSAEDMAPVLSAVLDPLIETCERSAEALKADAPSRVDEVTQIDPAARDLYLVNCLSAVMTVLQNRPAAAQHVRQLSERVEAHLAALVGGEVGRLLACAGMAEVVERLHHYQEARVHGHDGMSPPAADPALSLVALAEAMRSFFVLVSSPDALPEFIRMQVPRLRADTVLRVARSLADCYTMVVSVIEDPQSGYLEQGGVTAVKHTPAQVRTILGVI